MGSSRLFFIKLITAVATISMTLYFLHDSFLSSSMEDKTILLCAYIITVSTLVAVEAKMWQYCRYNMPCVNLEAKCLDDDLYIVYLDGKKRKYSGKTMHDTLFCKPGEHKLEIEYKGQRTEAIVEVEEMLLLDLHLYETITFDCEAAKFPADPRENRKVQNRMGLIYVIISWIMVITIMALAIFWEQRYDLLYGQRSCLSGACLLLPHPFRENRPYIRM